MRILLAIIGAGIVWVFRGFKNSFSFELYGGDEGKNKIPEDSNIWIGLIVIILLGLIIFLIERLIFY